MPYCGDTARITNSEFSTVEGYSFSITLQSNEIDVRSFPADPDTSGGFGKWLACNKSGTIQVESYLDKPLIAAQGLAGRSEWPLRIALEHDGLAPAGYSVALFYP
jgi:hypothetical protein